MTAQRSGKGSHRHRRKARRLPRRSLLLGGIVASFAISLGIGALIGRLGRPVRPTAATALPPRVAATPRSAPPRLMEEEPLPGDIYVPKLAARVPPPQPRATQASPTWLSNAEPLVAASGTPVVAIVIDDLGLDHAHTERAIGLSGGVTLAFMTYGEGLPQWTAAARAARHELLVHVPMQPLSPQVDPGPNALTTGLAEAEIRRRLRWGLDRMGGYVGANNHMGSRFTENAAGMGVVMDELKARGLLFLDSRTTAASACAPLAAQRDLPFAARNVFLDDDPTVAAVSRQIVALEDVARRHGSAIGIGHPHDGTLTALAEWLPTAGARGIAVVPLTSAMRHGMLRS
jgi:uncharacterized protein